MNDGGGAGSRVLRVACERAWREEARAVMARLPGVSWRWGGARDPYTSPGSGEADLFLGPARGLPDPPGEATCLAAVIPGAGAGSETAAVLCPADRADLRGLFFPLDVRNARGKVWLAGAGPGSSDLITLRAARILSAADIVFHDDLIDRSLLELCPGERRYVGKRKGAASCPQEAINDMLYRAALCSRCVVRLKGGDPGIYGRAGEELEYLRRRWVRVGMVPGVTAATAAAAAALVSLTQRRVSRSVTFLSGHGIAGGAPGFPGDATFVYYMAASRLAEIARDLLGRGVGSATPATVVSHAGAWNESCVSTTVGRLPEIIPRPPAVLIVGRAAASARIERKALFTGPGPEPVDCAEAVVKQALVEPASPRHPLPLRTVDPLPAPLDPAFFSSVILGSPREVDAFLAVYGGFPAHLLLHVPDEATRQALLGRGIDPWRIVTRSI